MRHGKKINSLGRTKSHKSAMLSNMACSLIEHKRINTTVAKAKVLRVYLEPLLTKAKTDSTHSRRILFSYLQNKDAITELFREIAPKIADRPGGYLRIIRIGNRLGDNAEMCMVELVDFNEVYDKEAAPQEKKTRRTRRGGAKKEDTVANSAKDASTKVETTKAKDKKEETDSKEEKSAKAETAPEKAAPKAKKETPKQEAKAETKKPAKKEAPKADAKKETPAKAKEAKKEEPKADAKKDAPKESPKKENKEEDKEKK